ncbi:hypothetical protein G9272_44810 [Streptomyces asoensis]|uniref:Uncharacterized protein n=1 Tax=Streptomyces asoensis TaxID=249586 RepID=A0A6M4X2V4_9ACTN|nr:hypothetical protein [Streptomyces asoensis]QJS98937.1 hypothetical protein G9272_00085 [Streptomyces asoensis]QJT06532.1 hypothetical protein G9272_44810 [Streptomyces asoensis]
MHTDDPAAYGGVRLARTVLDLAAADADAATGLAERTRHLNRLADVDGRLPPCSAPARRSTSW